MGILKAIAVALWGFIVQCARVFGPAIGGWFKSIKSVVVRIGESILIFLKAFVTALPTSTQRVLALLAAPFAMIFTMRFKKSTVLASLSVIVIAGSLASIVITQFRPSENINIQPYLAIGQIVAEETAKLLGEAGRVVVLGWSSDEYELAGAEAQMKTFKDTLRKSRAIQIVAIENIRVDPTSPTAGGLSPRKFIEICRTYPNTDAIVSFVGAPQLEDADIKQLPKPTPKLIAVTGFGRGVGPKQLFEKRVIQVAIVPRYQGLEQRIEPKTLREWFDQYYQVVTPATAATLPF